MSYTEQMASRSLTAASKVLFAKIMDNEPDVAARCPPADERRDQAGTIADAAGEPFALETCHLSAAEFPGLLDTPSDAILCLGFLSAIIK